MIYIIFISILAFEMFKKYKYRIIRIRAKKKKMKNH